MTKAVWKYNLPFENAPTIKMKAGAQVLSAGLEAARSLDKPTIVIWALVDIDAPEEWVDFFIRGTGHTIGDRVGRHVSTLQDDHFVWHVFEALPLLREDDHAAH